MAKVRGLRSYYGVAIHRDFVPLYVDESYAHLFGYDNAEQVLALPSLLSLISTEDHQEAIAANQAIMCGSARPKAKVYENRNRQGKRFSVMIIDQLTDWQGEPAIQVTIIDVSEQVAAEKRLEESEQRYRSLLETSIQGILVHRDFEPLYANQALVDLIGYDSPEDILNMPSLLSLIPEANQQQAMQSHEQLIERQAATNNFVVEYVRRDGTSVWLQITAAPVRWGDKPAVQAVMMDVSQQHQHQRRLEFQANHDALTGLINRRSMNATLIEAYASSKRSLRPLCCLLLDIDNFKLINDRYGHPAGDEALRVFAIESLKVLRDGDYLARWGGEEFLLLLPNSTQQQAMQVAERVRKHLADYRIVHGEHRFSTTVSIGLAMLSEYDSSAEALVARADGALYIAKERGKNRVELAPQVYQL
ncbi:sensor domain-containing diguanylate cyclase [Agarivorans sp. TSD2052]|uniref:sensor domain-containing diguanylate cyclase n=1 Tax=Agarivorans sp. TSD2052 TaxID=2937286 RepID=UPI00200BCC4A|nr:sensor domain-containing diguanylate cyclase [Agarivorans sp. TSD2052]UPW18356.1 sensor domain-containing diguanylate cyclase [Agarivorans sp. TSD2052]